MPFADVLYAADSSWWQKHQPDFRGEKWTCHPDAERLGLNYIRYEKGAGIGDGFVYTGYGNSGFQALNLALQWGCREIYLIGFDMKYRDGKKHWHPDHRGNNPTESQLDSWVRGFHEIRGRVKDRVKIVGDSAIDYPRAEFDELRGHCEGVIAVLRSGGWPTPEYAKRLADTLPQSVKYRLLTDMEVPGVDCIPLEHDWPGWWSKMEVMRPDIEGDWLYLDMDTMVYGDISPYLDLRRPCLLGDYYRPILETGVMYLTANLRHRIWKRWIESPDRWMHEYKGDGHFIRDTVGHLCGDIREVGGLHSYKVHGLQPDTRLLIFHGQPRPHETRLWTSR